MNPTPGSVVVVGVGNPWRTDDGVGPAVVEGLRTELEGRGVVVRCVDGEPARVLATWEGADLAVVVDAMRSGLPPGSVLVADGLSGEIPARPPTSSHAAGVAEAVALGRALDRLPAHLVLVGIEGASFGDGEGLSHGVAAAVAEAAALVRSAVGDRQAGD